MLLSHVSDSLKSMREVNDARDIDAVNFYRLVLIVRGISVSRPQNLAKFNDQYTNKPIEETNGKCSEYPTQSTRAFKQSG